MSLEGLTDDEIRGLEQELLDQLDQNGGAAGNISLIRALEWEEDTYWSVRDRLLDAGHLELGKGKGGSVHRVSGDAPAMDDDEGGTPDTVIEEDELYEPIAKVLKEVWVKNNRFRESLVEVTAKQGKRDTGGKWSRPDITVVGMTTYVYVPGRHFDVATFEIKPYEGIDVTAVYEALAHRRAATRAYVIFHVPEARRTAMEPVLDQISDEAKRHGVGLIVMDNPGDYASWDERVEASRIDPSPERLNDFISIQLSDGAKQEIVQWFK